MLIVCFFSLLPYFFCCCSLYITHILGPNSYHTPNIRIYHKHRTTPMRNSYKNFFESVCRCCHTHKKRDLYDVTAAVFFSKFLFFFSFLYRKFRKFGQRKVGGLTVWLIPCQKKGRKRLLMTWMIKTKRSSRSETTLTHMKTLSNGSLAWNGKGFCQVSLLSR